MATMHPTSRRFVIFTLRTADPSSQWCGTPRTCYHRSLMVDTPSVHPSVWRFFGLGYAGGRSLVDLVRGCPTASAYASTWRRSFRWARASRVVGHDVP